MIRPFPQRHVLTSATPRTVFRGIALADNVDLLAVALRFVLDHLDELIKAPFILHTPAQPFGSFMRLPRVLHHLLWGQIAEHDSAFSLSCHESRSFVQAVALLTTFLVLKRGGRPGSDNDSAETLSYTDSVKIEHDPIACCPSGM